MPGEGRDEQRIRPPLLWSAAASEAARPRPRGVVTMAPVYDLTLLLDTGATDDQRAKILSDTEAAINAEGTLVGKHDWGVRALAYEIRHKGDAEYHLFQFNATPALLERLQRSLRLTDGVVRFRIIKLAPGTPDPPAVRPEPPRPAEAEPPAETPTAEPVAAGAPTEAPPAETPAAEPADADAGAGDAPAPE